MASLGGLREMARQWWRGYLNDYFASKQNRALNGVLYLGISIVVAMLAFINLFAEFIVRDCDYAPDPYTSTWDNKLYPSAECYYEPRWYLLGLSLWEADKGQRLMLSILCGTALGYERRSPDRPAGIKMMSLVSLGSCCFTISSMFCFESSSSSFDTARVSAAIVSGVGFLGSAMIWKSSNGPENQVHGLTTAASVWVAASLGIAAGGKLYFIAIYTTIMVVLLLRFGPRSPEREDLEEEDSTMQDQLKGADSTASPGPFTKSESIGVKDLSDLEASSDRAITIIDRMRGEQERQDNLKRSSRQSSFRF